MKKILSTKILKQEQLELAKTFGWHIECLPFIGITPIVSEQTINFLKNSYDRPLVVILTSSNSVEMLKMLMPQAPTNWKIICISGATKEAVEYWLGNHSILYCGNSADEIIPSLYLFQRDEIVFFCGKRRLDTIPEHFKSLGKEITEVVLYETSLQEVKIDFNYDAYLFFSPSGVESFFKNNTLEQGKLVVSIGNTTAAKLKEYYSGEISISTQPNIIGVYQKINEHYVKNK